MEKEKVEVKEIIGDEGAEALASVLKNNSSLKSLDLSCNEIGDESAEALVSVLKNNSSLTSLYLIWSKIGDEGAKAILEALKQNKTLIDLQLWGENNISSEILKEINKKLECNRLIHKEKQEKEKSSDSAVKPKPQGKSLGKQ